MSKAFIFVGGTGCGKTYFVKQMIQNVNKKALLIFDTNNEYQNFYPYPFDADIDKFLEKAYKVKKAVILIEDATSFLSNRGNSEMLKKIMVAKRHTENTIILLFHSFRSVPKYIFDVSTHVAIFKTNDPKAIVEKFENEALTAAWERVQNNAKKSTFFSTYPPPKGVIPPSEIFKIY